MKRIFGDVYMAILGAAVVAGGCSGYAPDVGSLFSFGSRGPLVAEPAGVVGGMDVPMCVVVDDGGAAYVSNIEAEGSSAYWLDDGAGFISLLRAGGELDLLRWRNSNPRTVLNSPRGMCILNGRLYVADNSRIVSFALAGEGPGEIIEVPGEPQLVDVATDGAALYVADGRGGVVVRIEGAKISYLRGPKGLTAVAFAGGRLFAVSSAEHDVYEIDLSGGGAAKAFGLANHFGGLGGIDAMADGTLIVSDFERNKVLAIDADHEDVTTLIELPDPALIGVDQERDILYVPQFTANQVSVFRLGRG